MVGLAWRTTWAALSCCIDSIPLLKDSARLVPHLHCCMCHECHFARAGLDFVFHMFFLVKYSKSLEEGSFRGRSADFLWMLMFGALPYPVQGCHRQDGAPCRHMLTDS